MTFFIVNALSYFGSFSKKKKKKVILALINISQIISKIGPQIKPFHKAQNSCWQNPESPTNTSKPMPKKTIAIFIKTQDNHLVISIKAVSKR